MFRVSQSKVKTWRQCRRKYHYRYVENIRRKRKSRPLQFGSMIHQALEFHFNGDEIEDYFEGLRGDVAAMRLFAAEREEYGDILEDVEDIITDYVEYWAEDDIRPVRIAGRGAEHSFEIEILPQIIWNGKIDFIGKTPNKLRWLGEHKTYSRRPSDDDRWRNLQSVTYFRANDILGWAPLDGCAWDYVRSKPPAVPGVLKDGTLSTKKIDTLPARVHRIIGEHEGDSGNTDAILSMAEANRSNYFERIHTPVNNTVSDLVFADFEASIKEMIAGHGTRQEMNIDRHCSWCDYEQLCRARLQGLDTDYILRREYEDGEERKPDEKVHVADYSAVQAFARKKGK